MYDKRALTLETATFLEQNPSLYRFSQAHIPPDGKMGCVLGHMGKLANLPVGMAVSHVADKILGIPERTVYAQWDFLAGGDPAWRSAGRKVGEILRKWVGADFKVANESYIKMIIDMENDIIRSMHRAVQDARSQRMYERLRVQPQQFITDEATALPDNFWNRVF